MAHEEKSPAQPDPPTRYMVSENRKSSRAPLSRLAAAGKLVLGIFASWAEFERELIAERTRGGLASARAPGRKGGRRLVLRKGGADLGRLSQTVIFDLCSACPNATTFYEKFLGA